MVEDMIQVRQLPIESLRLDEFGECKGRNDISLVSFLRQFVFPNYWKTKESTTLAKHVVQCIALLWCHPSVKRFWEGCGDIEECGCLPNMIRATGVATPQDWTVATSPRMTYAQSSKLWHIYINVHLLFQQMADQWTNQLVFNRWSILAYFGCLPHADHKVRWSQLAIHSYQWPCSQTWHRNR